MNQARSINKIKTTEAIALILKLHHKPIILNHLLKMMYFIDRLCLAQTNQSLTNDSYVCKKDGLIPQHIPDLIVHLQIVEIIKVSETGLGYIALNQDIIVNGLTTLDKKFIDCVYKQKKDINPFNILDWQYDLKFIKNHLKTHNNNTITAADILHSLGKNQVKAITDKSYSNHKSLKELKTKDYLSSIKVANY